MKKIPIMLCFNENYVIPGICTISSLVKNSSRDYHYSFYVLHSDISEKYQKKMLKLTAKHQNIDISFIDMSDQFNDMFDGVPNQSYWSKEVFFKCVASSILPQYDRIIITDVDVLFCDDIVPDWEDFQKDQENYIAGIRLLSRKSDNDEYGDWVYKDWNREERQKVLTGGGYWLQNLALIRKDSMEENFLDFAKKNLYRLTQNEQQVINMVCYPKIKLLHPKAMVCSYDYKTYSSAADYDKDRYYSAEIVAEALASPIQLHYAGAYKPWNVLFTEKSFLWWKELLSQHDFSLFADAVFRLLKQKVYLQLLRDKIRVMIQKSGFMRLLYRFYKHIKP